MGGLGVNEMRGVCLCCLGWEGGKESYRSGRGMGSKNRLQRKEVRGSGMLPDSAEELPLPAVQTVEFQAVR